MKVLWRPKLCVLMGSKKALFFYYYPRLINTLVFGANLANLLCSAVVCICQSTIHDGVDKIRVDPSYMAACAHGEDITGW